MVGQKAEKRKERGKKQVREETRGRFYKLNSAVVTMLISAVHKLKVNVDVHAVPNIPS